MYCAFAAQAKVKLVANAARKNAVFRTDFTKLSFIAISFPCASAHTTCHSELKRPHQRLFPGYEHDSGIRAGFLDSFVCRRGIEDQDHLQVGEHERLDHSLA